jgi:hypothetical protein
MCSNLQYNREEWKKLPRTARNHRILRTPTEWTELTIFKQVTAAQFAHIFVTKCSVANYMPEMSTTYIRNFNGRKKKLMSHLLSLFKCILDIKFYESLVCTCVCTTFHLKHTELTLQPAWNSWHELGYRLDDAACQGKNFYLLENVQNQIWSSTSVLFNMYREGESSQGVTLPTHLHLLPECVCGAIPPHPIYASVVDTDNL